MGTDDIIKTLTGLAYWLVVAAFIGVPLFFSIYILVTPAHKLIFVWQNYRMSRSKKVLKDRHFKNMPRIIKLCKLLSVILLVACGWAIASELGYDVFSLFGQ